MSYLKEVSYPLYLMRECFVDSRKFVLVHICCLIRTFKSPSFYRVPHPISILLKNIITNLIKYFAFSFIS